MEPQESPAMTFYGVMSRVYQDAYDVHSAIVSSPEYQAMMQALRETDSKKSSDKGRVRAPQSRPAASSLASGQVTSGLTTPIDGRKIKSITESDFGKLPGFKGGHNRSDGMISEEGLTEATDHATSQHDVHLKHTPGHRVKSAAASFIFKKWGYDTRPLLKDTSVNLETFMDKKTLKKDHEGLMMRLDKAIEQEVVTMDKERRLSVEFRSTGGFMRRAEIDSLNKCKPETQVFTTKKKQQTAINILE